MRIHARDIKSGDIVDGARVVYNTHSATGKAYRIIKLDDGRSWFLHHAEKQEVERKVSE